MVISRYKFTTRHKIQVYDIVTLLIKFTLYNQLVSFSCLLNEAAKFKAI